MENKQNNPGTTFLIIIGSVLVGFGALSMLSVILGFSAWSIFRIVSRLIGPLFLLGAGIFVIYLASSGAFARRTPAEGAPKQDYNFAIPPSGTNLYRSTTNRMIGGVCGGLAEYFGIDPTIVRIIAVLLFFWGAGFLAYLIAWIVIPPNPN